MHVANADFTARGTTTARNDAVDETKVYDSRLLVDDTRLKQGINIGLSKNNVRERTCMHDVDWRRARVCACRV